MARRALRRDHMAARHWPGDIGKGPGLFIAGVGQRFVRRHLEMLARIIFGVEGDALALQPFIMGDAVLAINADLVVRGVGHGAGEEGDHVFSRIVETVRLLRVRSTADIDIATRRFGRTAAARGALDHQHVKAALRRVDRRRSPRRAKAHDHQIGAVDEIRLPGGHRLKRFHSSLQMLWMDFAYMRRIMQN
jgi:hypothetical protein